MPVANTLSLTRWLPLVFVAVTATAWSRGQCGLQWQPGQLPGTDGVISAVAPWDPDGPGPAGPQIVFGGGFGLVGNVPCSSVGFYDPGSGSFGAWGQGLNGSVQVLCAGPNGDLLAGGWFTQHFARLNGTAWQAVGGGTDGVVRDIAVAPNGDLFVVGMFQNAGTVAANGVARWDGTAWHALGTGVTGAMAIEALPSGDVVVAGAFTSAGGTPTQNIARWDGASWFPLAGGIVQGSANSAPLVEALAALPNGDLVVGGQFYVAGGVPVSCVARWDGTAWYAMGPYNQRVVSLLVRANGELVAGIYAQNGIMFWNGASWSTPAQGQQLEGIAYDAAEMPNGDLYVGGSFTAAGGVDAFHLARWNGTAWSAPIPGLPPSASIDDLIVMANGDVVARGSFRRIGGVQADRFARWDGSSWYSLGTPPLVTWNTWLATANGDLLVMGFNVGSVSGLTRWDGTAWSLALPFPSTVNALAQLPDGDIVLGGWFPITGSSVRNLVRWDGTSVTPFAGGTNGLVMKLWRLRNGDLVANGTFTAAGPVAVPGLARWDGASWSPIGTSTVGVLNSLVEMPNGDLVVSGPFSSIGGLLTGAVARWDGTNWSPMGLGMFGHPDSLALLPGGDVVAGGGVVWSSPNVSANLIARWDGAAWHPLGAGFRGGLVQALVMRPDGEICAGGTFTSAGGMGSAYFARLKPECPASAQSYGAGCASSAGTMQLAVDRLPWLGDTFRITCSGIAANGLAFAVFGLSPAVGPLAPWHPGTSPACSRLVSPLGSVWGPPAAGIATFAWTLPNDLALVGVSMRHQTVQAELGPGLQVLAFSSSNAVETIVGAL